MAVRRFSLLSVCLSLLLVASAPALAQHSNESALVAGNTEFAFRLYPLLRSANAGNLIYAPYSISQAFAMTYAGARGNTEKQMADVMRFALAQTDLHPAMNAVNADLMARGNQVEDKANYKPPRSLRIANALWPERTYTFKQPFIDLTGKFYAAALYPVDFVNAPEPSRVKINQWVADQTNDLIKDLIGPGVITSDTRLVLTNAVYFRNLWLYQFDKDATKDDVFHLLDGKTVNVPLMHQEKLLAYGSGKGYQAVELPFVGGDTAMLIIVPGEGQFVGFEQALDTKLYTEIVDSLRPEMVQLAFPRFKYELPASLSSLLKQMGMTDAFDPSKADFSGMADVTPGQNLYISDALHKAFVSVDEDGTEAAGATAVIMGVTSAAPPPDNVIQLRVDRPFIYIIRDQQTGTVLFVGSVLNPTAS